jgi:hypothetical protein
MGDGDGQGERIGMGPGRTLIAILSCHRHRRWQDAQRQTWIRDVPPSSEWDCRFFLGNPPPDRICVDEVFLDVPDDYMGLLLKTRGIMGWALGQGFDHVYKADIDTLVVPSNLASSGFEQHDYVGGVNRECPPVIFASGGSGYCLSRRAMELVAAAEPWPGGGPEDVFVADTLAKNGIAPHDDARYQFYPGSVPAKDTISCHLSSVGGWKRAYLPEQMFDAYKEAKSLW